MSLKETLMLDLFYVIILIAAFTGLTGLAFACGRL
jgi:hypothetical protein